MSEPSLLFVYRLARVDRHWHAKCISCSPEPPEEWPEDCWTGFVLPDGPTVRIRQLLYEALSITIPVDDESSGRSDTAVTTLSDADWVHAVEPIVSASPSEARCKLITMQNYTCIILDGLVKQVAMPAFVGVSTISVPRKWVAEVTMQVQCIDDLPDVKQYMRKNDEYLQSGKADKWDRMMLQPMSEATFPIPENVFLPGTIGCNRCETDVVYGTCQRL